MNHRIRALGIAFVVALACLAASSAGANFIANGDFEIVDGRVGDARGKALDSLSSGRWDVYRELPGGWYTSAGRGIEVEYDGTVVDAFSGDHYIELDSHPRPGSNSAMSQDIVLDADDYLLEFAYRPRTSTPGDNGIRVLFGGVEVAFLDGTAGPGSDWENVAVELSDVAAGEHTLTIAAVGIENTLGGFVDAFSLTSVLGDGPGGELENATPEPGAGLVFATGMLVAGVASRRRRD